MLLFPGVGIMPTTQFLMTSAQVLRAISELDGEVLALRTLASWASLKLVIPHVWPKQRLEARLYSPANLAEARLVVRLRRLGLSLQRVRQIMARPDVRQALKPSTREVLIVQGQRVFVRHPEADVDVEQPSGQYTIRLADVHVGLQETAARVTRSA